MAARQVGIYSTLGVVVLNDTRNAETALPGIVVTTTGGGGATSAFGTAPGQASALGVVNTVHGTANGQGSANGVVSFTGGHSAAGTAAGQATALGGAGAIVGVAGTAAGQASVMGIVPGTAQAFLDGLTVQDILGVSVGYGLADRITADQSDQETYIWGPSISDAMSMHLSSAVLANYKITDVETIKLAAGIFRGFPTTLTQDMTVQGATTVAIALTMLQRLGMIPHFSATTDFHLSLAQAIHLNDALNRFFDAVTLSQAMHVHPTQAVTYLASAAMSQALTVHPALANTLMLCFNETIDIAPTQLLKAVYQGESMLEGINLNGLYVMPDGTVTTWVVNTRTNAVTTYDNYDFNGFAQLGGRYIGTSHRGVYELDGETDDGRYIIADILSGFMQFNQTKMSGLKGVYLAMRGEGVFFLKLIAGDRREYVYKLQSQPGLMNAKVNVGKGLRTRYLAFQLTSTGADFDLDSLEFVPMMSDRRV